MDLVNFVLLYKIAGLILASAIIGSWFSLVLTSGKMTLLRYIALALVVIVTISAISSLPSRHLGLHPIVGFILTYGVYVISMVVTAVIVARRKREAEWAAITKTQEFWKELLDEDGFLLHDIKPRS